MTEQPESQIGIFPLAADFARQFVSRGEIALLAVDAWLTAIGRQFAPVQRWIAQSAAPNSPNPARTLMVRITFSAKVILRGIGESVAPSTSDEAKAVLCPLSGPLPLRMISFFQSPV